MVSLTVFCGVTIAHCCECVVLGVGLREQRVVPGQQLLCGLDIDRTVFTNRGRSEPTAIAACVCGVCVAAGGCAREVTDLFLSLSGRGKKRM